MEEIPTERQVNINGLSRLLLQCLQAKFYSLTGGTAMTTPLHQKMMEDLQLYRLSERILETYIESRVRR